MAEAAVYPHTPTPEAEQLTRDTAVKIPEGYDRFTFFILNETGETSLVIAGPDVPAMRYMGGNGWQPLYVQDARPS